MNAKILHSLVFTLAAGSIALYQRYHGNSWWLWALIASLFFAALIDGISDYSKSRGGTGLPKLCRFMLLSASAFMIGLAVSDGLRGNGWLFPLIPALILLFFSRTAGLPDSQPALQEPSFDPDVPPQIPLEEALFTGSDSDFTFYIHQSFPVTDWKDDAEETLKQFLPLVPEFRFDVSRSPKQTDVLFRLGTRSETVTLEISAETAQLIEPLAHFWLPITFSAAIISRKAPILGPIPFFLPHCGTF